jgi:hypothetical protein
MRKSSYFILLSMVISLAVMASCGKKTQNVAVVAGQPVTLEEFNLRFDYYLRSKYYQQPELIPQARNSMEERKAVLKDMINEKLILMEAKKMKLDQREDVKNLLKLYTQQIVLNAYIEQFMANDIQVSDEEVKDFYGKNREKFKMVDPDNAARSIKYQLMMQRYEKKITEILDKLKGFYRVEYNESAIRPIYNETNVSRNLKNMMPGMPGGATPPPAMLNKGSEAPKEKK